MHEQGQINGAINYQKPDNIQATIQYLKKDETSIVDKPFMEYGEEPKKVGRPQGQQDIQQYKDILDLAREGKVEEALGFALDESVDADTERVRVRAGDDAGEHSLAMETLYREAFVQSEDLGDRLRAIGFALDEEPLPEAPPGPEASLVRVDDGEDEHLSFLRWLIAHQEETRRRQRAVARRHRWHEIVHGEVQLDAQGAPLLDDQGAPVLSRDMTVSDDGKTAVDAQISMLRACGYERVDSQDRTREMIRLIDLECLSLHLMRTLDRGAVTPLLFERMDDNTTLAHNISENLDPDYLSSEDVLQLSEEVFGGLINNQMNEEHAAASDVPQIDSDPDEPSNDLLNVSDSEIEDTVDPPNQSIDMTSTDIAQALDSLEKRV